MYASNQSELSREALPQTTQILMETQQILIERQVLLPRLSVPMQGDILMQVFRCNGLQVCYNLFPSC